MIAFAVKAIADVNQTPLIVQRIITFLGAGEE